MKKNCIPIVSCNPTYFGLDVPAWAVNFLLFSAVTFWVSLFNPETIVYWVILIVQIILNYIYVKTILTLEENIIVVMMNNFKIPNIILGFFQSLPEKPNRVEDNVSK